MPLMMMMMVVFPPCLVIAVTKMGMALSMYVAVEGSNNNNPAIVTTLVNVYRQNVNKDSDVVSGVERMTPLMEAAIYGDGDIIRFLLSRGAEKNVVTCDSNLPPTRNWGYCCC
jgi:hypothetical protein